MVLEALYVESIFFKPKEHGELSWEELSLDDIIGFFFFLRWREKIQLHIKA